MCASECVVVRVCVFVYECAFACVRECVFLLDSVCVSVFVHV